MFSLRGIHRSPVQWYSLLIPLCHADVMALAHYPNYWSSMREIHRWRLPYKGQVTGSFSDFCDLVNKLLNIQLSYRWLGKPWHSHGVKAMITRDIYTNDLYSTWRCDGNAFRFPHSLLWRHNGRDSVSNHQPHDCLLNRLFRRRSKKTSKLRVTGLCVGNSPGTGEFPTQMASNAVNVSIWWRHHDWRFVRNHHSPVGSPTKRPMMRYFVWK